MTLEPPDHEANVRGEGTDSFPDMSRWSWSVWDPRPTSEQKLPRFVKKSWNLRDTRPTSVPNLSLPRSGRVQGVRSTEQLNQQPRPMKKNSQSSKNDADAPDNRSPRAWSRSPSTRRLVQVILEHPEHEARVGGEVTDFFHALSNWFWSVWDTRPDLSEQSVSLRQGSCVHDLRQSRPVSEEIGMTSFHDSPENPGIRLTRTSQGVGP